MEGLGKAGVLERSQHPMFTRVLTTWVKETQPSSRGSGRVPSAWENWLRVENHPAASRRRTERRALPKRDRLGSEDQA